MDPPVAEAKWGYRISDVRSVPPHNHSDFVVPSINTLLSHTEIHTQVNARLQEYRDKATVVIIMSKFNVVYW